MTTTIPSTRTDRTASLGLTSSGNARLWVGDPDGTGREIVMETSAVLDAVRTELGVLIIDKAVLPIVTDRGVHGSLFVGDNRVSTMVTVEEVRQEAYERLALAEYLEAHPPIDEQQVEALVTLLGDFAVADEHTGCRDDAVLARSLVARGVRVEVQS